MLRRAVMRIPRLTGHILLPLVATFVPALVSGCGEAATPAEPDAGPAGGNAGGSGGTGGGTGGAAGGSGGAGGTGGTPDPGGMGGQGGEPTPPPLADPTLPVAQDSPWPKFRRDARQTGAGTVPPEDAGLPPWRFRTGKGIFSSPVVGGDETIYIGSADRTFYALRDGEVVWRFDTGEIIDSAAVLDDRGRVYFGSGDGHVYALDATTGEQKWSFEADPPETQNALIRWFEGNVGIGPDGTLYAGNDNFHLYALDRDTGAARWRAVMPDQTWSLAAVDVERSRLYVGNVNVLGARGNVFALDLETGEQLWRFGRDGSVAASPALAGDTTFVGAYDGFLRALAVDDGAPRWEVGLRDHLYASPALTADGGLIQAGADGSVYALNAADGTVRWVFDWGAPLRSSPALDPEGRVYLGTGDGHLLVLHADGTLDWALRLVTEPRDDLNASPALGHRGVYLAGESGEIFGVPYHYCRRTPTPDGCRLGEGADEPLPADAALLVPTGPFGELGPPVGPALEPLAVNAPLVRSLLLRRAGDTPLAMLDGASLRVETTPPVPLEAEVSSNGQFIVLTPAERWLAGPDGASFEVSIEVDVREGLERTGLVFRGGEVSTHVSHSEVVSLAPPPPGAAPPGPGDVYSMTRLAAPLPTLLPSYNQIGFDSLHYLIGVVEPGVAWVIEAMPDGAGGVVPNPGARGRFPFGLAGDTGALTMSAAQGVGIDVLNTNIAFEQFRVSGRPAAVEGPSVFSVIARTRCGAIPVYGVFIRRLGLCHPTTDLLLASGAVNVGRAPEPPGPALEGVTVTFESSDAGHVARLNPPLPAEVAGAHAFGLLGVDADTGAPLPWPYGQGTRLETDANGALSAVALDLPADAPRPGALRLHLMIDVTRVATGP